LHISRYEPFGVYFPRPWIIVVANCRPDVSKMSADRWNIVHTSTLGAVSFHVDSLDDESLNFSDHHGENRDGGRDIPQFSVQG
jgi:hypothetical protein